MFVGDVALHSNQRRQRSSASRASGKSGCSLSAVSKWAAASVVRPDGDRDQLLEDGGDLSGMDSTKLDADLGLMASAGRLKAGITLRNASEPSFDSEGGGPPWKLSGADFALDAGYGVQETGLRDSGTGSPRRPN